MSAREVEKLATGGVWIGQQAVAVGLADRVGTFDQVVAELGAQFGPVIAARDREERETRERQAAEQRRAEERHANLKRVAKALDDRRVERSEALVAALVGMGWVGCARGTLSPKYEMVAADDLEAIGSRLDLDERQLETLRTKVFFEERVTR
jgi:ClpP class serine protease